jgi:hypothetical protein
MNEEEFKTTVKRVFNQLGLKTKDLKTCNTVRVPDFEVTGNTDKYTVELKIKDDNPADVEAEIQALYKGELVGKSTPMGPRNRLAAIIHEGVEQMFEHDPRGETYRVIWLHSAGQYPEEHDTRFRATLFGTETLFSLKLSNVLTCFYFHESVFYSCRDYLDGAILTCRNDAQLCINTLSHRVDKFRKSELVQSMSKGLCDPDKLQGLNKGVLIADCPYDRKDSNKILTYLRAKYGLDHLQTIPMIQHTGTILLDFNQK